MSITGASFLAGHVDSQTDLNIREHSCRSILPPSHQDIAAKLTDDHAHALSFSFGISTPTLSL